MIEIILSAVENTSSIDENRQTNKPGDAQNVSLTVTICRGINEDEGREVETEGQSIVKRSSFGLWLYG